MVKLRRQQILRNIATIRPTYNSGNLNQAVKSYNSSINNTKKAYCEYRCVLNIFTDRFEDLVSKETKNKLSGS